MSKPPIHERIVEQFSDQGERADAWGAFDRILDTGAFLNLGYSPWYLPHVVGSSQRRLSRVVGDGLAGRVGETRGVPLVDVGCGRGGPAATLAGADGFHVVGVDLVPYNVAVARRNVSRLGIDAEFLVGDAASLPVATDAMGAATAIDSIVYVPDRPAVFEEFARVLRPEGVVAVSDLVAAEDSGDDAGAALDAFADAWDMPTLLDRERYLSDVEAAGLVVEAVRDLGPNSVDRFPKWSRFYLALSEHTSPLVDRALAAAGFDADRVTEQVRTAHAALPHLRHVLVYARAG